MKYAITAETPLGDYKALVDIDLGEKNFSGDQSFTGSITTDRYGRTLIHNGHVQPGSGLLIGEGEIAGIGGKFQAKIDGAAISGEIDYGPFHALTANFNGIEAV